MTQHAMHLALVSLDKPIIAKGAEGVYAWARLQETIVWCIHDIGLAKLHCSCRSGVPTRDTSCSHKVACSAESSVIGWQLERYFQPPNRRLALAEAWLSLITVLKS